MRIRPKTVTDSDASMRPGLRGRISIGWIFSHATNPRGTVMKRIESWSEFYRERLTIADAINRGHLDLVRKLPCTGARPVRRRGLRTIQSYRNAVISSNTKALTAGSSLR